MSVTGMPVKAMLVALMVRKIPNPKIQIPNKSQIPIAASAHSLSIVLRDNGRKNQHELPGFPSQVVASSHSSWTGLNQPQEQPALFRLFPANFHAQQEILFA